MTEYAITFARSARRELEAIDRSLSLRILAKIEELATEPRPPGCLKLQSRGGLWRLRVGDYRVVYSVDDSEKIVDVVVIRHRRDVYR